ncbi:MAG: hypothetical protein AB7H80_08770 [Candidatus Kapaibacterium sp.]
MKEIFMNRGRFQRWGIVALLVSFVITGCEETPVQPNVGNGKELKGTIDGQAITFDIETSLSEYDTSILFGRFGGSTSALPVQSITITFNFDIDKGSFPTTLTGADITITLVVEGDGGTDIDYNCTSDCSITLIESDGEIVDGTFQGTLVNSKDSSDTITITNGSFSVRLART